MRPRFSAINILVALVGAALLVYTIRQVGWTDVVAGVASVGWWFVIVVLLGASRMAFRSRAWMICAEQPPEHPSTRAPEHPSTPAPEHPSTRAPQHPSTPAPQHPSTPAPQHPSTPAPPAPQHPQLRFADAFGAMLAADAVGNLTPLGLLASEPTKIIMARSRISTVTSVASVTIENAFYIVSVALVLLAGTWFFFQRAAVPPALEQTAEAIVAAVAIGGVVAVWAARSQPAVLSRIAPLITRLVGRARMPPEALREVESRIYGVLQWPLGRLGRVAAWEAAFHVAAVTEVWLVLRLLPDGDRTTIIDAFLMESAGRFVTIAFKFIPYRLGIDEAGSGAVAQVLGFNPVTGVTLALIRRLRILCLNAVGLVILARK